MTFTYKYIEAQVEIPKKTPSSEGVEFWILVFIVTAMYAHRNLDSILGYILSIIKRLS